MQDIRGSTVVVLRGCLSWRCGCLRQGLWRQGLRPGGVGLRRCVGGVLVGVGAKDASSPSASLRFSGSGSVVRRVVVTSDRWVLMGRPATAWRWVDGLLACPLAWGGGGEAGTGRPILGGWFLRFVAVRGLWVTAATGEATGGYPEMMPVEEEGYVCSIGPGPGPTRARALEVEPLQKVAENGTMGRSHQPDRGGHP